MSYIETLENHTWDIGDNVSYNVTSVYGGAWEDSLWQTVIEDYKKDLLTLNNTPTLVLLVLYVPIFIMSLVGNVIVLLVIIPNQRMRTVTNNFLVNLAVADLLGKLIYNITIITIGILESVMTSLCSFD